MDQSNVQNIIDSIVNEAIKTKNSKAIKFAEIIKEVPFKFQKYYPEKDLKKGIERIKEDKEFIEPKSIRDINPELEPDEFIEGFNKLLWEDKILKRFKLFAAIKVICELVTENAPSNISNSNNLQEYIEFISSLMMVIEPGLQSFKSITLNSQRKNNAGRTTIPHAKFLIDKFEDEIRSYKRLVAVIPGSDEQKQQIALFLSSFNIDEYQTYIFDGILNDFDISKKGTTGDQSVRYKSELLWYLFIHTHKKYHHYSDVQGADARSIRTKNLKKIITPQSNSQIKEFLT